MLGLCPPSHAQYRDGRREAVESDKGWEELEGMKLLAPGLVVETAGGRGKGEAKSWYRGAGSEAVGGHIQIVLTKRQPSRNLDCGKSTTHAPALDYLLRQVAGGYENTVAAAPWDPPQAMRTDRGGIDYQVPSLHYVHLCLSQPPSRPRYTLRELNTPLEEGSQFTMGVGVLEAVQEEEAATLEEARRSLSALRNRNKAQTRLLVAWKRRLKEQNVLLQHLQRERDHHLRTIQSQLMIFESQLRRRQKEVEVLLHEKEATIQRQQLEILSLSRALNNQQEKQEPASTPQNTTETIDKEIQRDGKQTENEDENTLKKDNFSIPLTVSSKSDPESLNDSDSAIMLEENFDSLVINPLVKGEVKVVRSVSDAVEVANRSSCPSNTSVTGCTNSLLKPGFNSCNGPGSLSTSPSCSSEESDDSPSCTLTKGRAELLRTVYSLEEEESILKSPSHYDSDATLSDGESEEEDNTGHADDSCNDRRQLLGSYEKLNTLGATPRKPKAEEEIQVTYNRVMSNHRSVTKPKDVKYRRINKAKSRSLEELRGKLKYWTDRGGKQSLSVDLDNHSFA
ncbi:hypothetical protein E2C01_005479 [Portunus trituberculatus]|uniref:Uncharacterized protein n=1 Tax=Portunus trituberculatus TaxID=210409 RepID=A0A5B7CTL1_PORTR|nr:hypothetical protein [Portunus trituberculatus]